MYVEARQEDRVADPRKKQARKAGRAVPKATGKCLQTLRKIKPHSLGNHS